MKPALLALTAWIGIFSWLSPLNAAERTQTSDHLQTTAQSTPTAQQVLNACVQNRAETLPNPFVDVPQNHWAYKAVLTLYYCGPYRQATPPSLIERLTNG